MCSIEELHSAGSLYDRRKYQRLSYLGVISHLFFLRCCLLFYSRCRLLGRSLTRDSWNAIDLVNSKVLFSGLTV